MIILIQRITIVVVVVETCWDATCRSISIVDSVEKVSLVLISHFSFIVNTQSVLQLVSYAYVYAG